MLLKTKFISVVLSVLSVLCCMILQVYRSSGILLQCCNRQAVPSSKFPTREPLLTPIGGGRQYLFSNSSIVSFIKQGGDKVSPDHVFRYVDHMDDIGCVAYPLEQGFVYANLTLAHIVPFLSKKMVQKIAQIHKIPISSNWNLTKDDLVKMFYDHSCINCTLYTSVLEAQLSPSL